ncbi:hypothetical protein Tcan_01201, partial [Toxocara canis]
FSALGDIVNLFHGNLYGFSDVKLEYVFFALSATAPTASLNAHITFTIMHSTESRASFQIAFSIVSAQLPASPLSSPSYNVSNTAYFIGPLNLLLKTPRRHPQLFPNGSLQQHSEQLSMFTCKYLLFPLSCLSTNHLMPLN